MNDRYAQGRRLMRTVNPDQLSAHVQTTAVGLESPGDDFDQRRLSCSILTKQRVDFALSSSQVDMIERPRAAKMLGYIASLKNNAAGVVNGHSQTSGNGVRIFSYSPCAAIAPLTAAGRLMLPPRTHGTVPKTKHEIWFQFKSREKVHFGRTLSQSAQ